eukprot:1368269-Alexandrium_andersonii.AAC.1
MVDCVLKGRWFMEDLVMRHCRFGVALLRLSAFHVRAWLVGLAVGASGRWHDYGVESGGSFGGNFVENERLVGGSRSWLARGVGLRAADGADARGDRCVAGLGAVVGA